MYPWFPSLSQILLKNSLGESDRFQEMKIGMLAAILKRSVLFYFILFYFILFYFILFYFILFYFILFSADLWLSYMHVS